MCDSFFTKDELQEISEWFYTSKEITGEGSKWVKFGLNKALRCKTDFVSVKRVSENVLLENKQLFGLTRDMVRKSKLNINGLVFEHFIPLNSIVERCLNSNSINEIKNILQEMEVVWITENENKCLTNNGYFKNGRETKEKAEKAYKICGIELKGNQS